MSLLELEYSLKPPMVKQVVWSECGPDSPNIALKEPSGIDYYSQMFGRAPAGTIVIDSLPQPGVVAFPSKRPGWESWLVETFLNLSTAATRSSIAEQVAYVESVFGLSDSELAQAFPGGVERETVNRWKNRRDPNPRKANVYRLGLLRDLGKKAERLGLEARVWFRQPLSLTTPSPYQLVCDGRLGEVIAALDAALADAQFERTPEIEVSRMTRAFDEFSETDNDDDDWTPELDDEPDD